MNPSLNASNTQLATRIRNSSIARNRMYGQHAIENHDFKVGSKYETIKDMDIQFEDTHVTVPSGTIIEVKGSDESNLMIDFGPQVGGGTLSKSSASKFLGREILQQHESSMHKHVRKHLYTEAELNFYPGRRVRITRYDPTIGPNRGPKAPPFGYGSLIGQEGLIQINWMLINGIQTYKVSLVQGGDFILGSTEMDVLSQ